MDFTHQSLHKLYHPQMAKICREATNDEIKQYLNLIAQFAVETHRHYHILMNETRHHLSDAVNTVPQCNNQINIDFSLSSTLKSLGQRVGAKWITHSNYYQLNANNWKCQPYTFKHIFAPHQSKLTKQQQQQQSLRDILYEVIGQRFQVNNDLSQSLVGSFYRRQLTSHHSTIPTFSIIHRPFPFSTLIILP